MTDYGYPCRSRLLFAKRRPMPPIRTCLAFVLGVCVAAVWLGFTRG